MLKDRERIPEIELPKNLHNNIIGDLFFLKFKFAFLAAAALLPINLLFIGWHIWLSAAEAETLTLLTTLFNDFEVSFDFVSDFLRTITDTIPLSLIIAFTLNLLLLIYMLVAFQSTLKNYPLCKYAKNEKYS